jgi:hypothetical protein
MQNRGQDGGRSERGRSGRWPGGGLHRAGDVNAHVVSGRQQQGDDHDRPSLAAEPAHDIRQCRLVNIDVSGSDLDAGAGFRDVQSK